MFSSGVDDMVQSLQALGTIIQSPITSIPDLKQSYWWDDRIDSHYYLIVG